MIPKKTKGGVIINLRLVILEKNSGNCMDVQYMGVEEGMVSRPVHADFMVYPRILSLLQMELEEVFPWKRCKLSDV